MLEKIQKENDIKKIKSRDLDALAAEIREFLLTHVSRTGGHLASNLGAVELTMALHLVFHLPEDKIIWDVGHQAYTHKLLTGRRDGFESLRSYGGMSGFPKRKESPCDAFGTGHSSTSISAGLGYVRARDLKQEKYAVISVIGDGALTGGMAYEALNNAASLDTNFIIVLNDNNMSISNNVGGMSRYLSRVRTAGIYTGLKKGVENALQKVPRVGDAVVEQIRRTKSGIKQLFIPGMFFEDMGITYLGPVDGHNIKVLTETMKEAKKVKGTVLVHVVTEKGKGYDPAEKEPRKYHGVEPFDLQTGTIQKGKKEETYTDVFGRVLCEEAKKRDDLVAITAAMTDGTGLTEFARLYPDRFFDVGIAEEHAVTFAAGLAAGGLKPVFAVYSSFLQRGYDQLIHDVSLQNLPVVFAIDRAGLVGGDGETHQGIFDLSYLSSIPNMTVLSPKNKWELEAMLKFALDFDGPIALRYPREEAYLLGKEFDAPIEYGKSERIYKGKDLAVISVGHMFPEAVDVCRTLKEEGYYPSLINARFVKPLDEEMIRSLSADHALIAVIEENVNSGGYGEQVMACVMRENLPVRVLSLSLPDDYVEHGSVETLREKTGLDVETMVGKIQTAYQELAR